MNAVAFEAPEGLALGYSATRETWHHRHSTFPGDVNVLMVGLYGQTGGGCRWEFAIDEEDAGGRCLRVKIYDEAWAAFTEVPEFFAALAELGRGAMTEDVVPVLDRLGFRDMTARVNPHTQATTPATNEET